eukprot:5156842-Prymnesium_polylepis.1
MEARFHIWRPASIFGGRFHFWRPASIFGGPLRPQRRTVDSSRLASIISLLQTEGVSAAGSRCGRGGSTSHSPSPSAACRMAAALSG